MQEELLDNKIYNKTLVRPNDQRAKYAQFLILVILILDLVSIFSSWMQLNLLNKLNAGIIPDDSALVSNDLREMILGYVYIAIYIVSIVTFLSWFRRAYYNLSQRTIVKYTNGWAAGAWFVPILSLFRPVQIMAEMWDGTSLLIANKDGRDEGKRGIIPAWWTLWIISNLLANFVRRSSTNAASVDDFIFSTQADIVLSILSIPLCLLAILLIRTYNQKELELLRLDQDEPRIAKSSFQVEDEF